MKLTGKTLLAALSLLCILCAVAVGWAAYSTAMYLMTDVRFEVQKLSVSGLKRVEENQVLAKAGFDVGTNVFRVKLDEITQPTSPKRSAVHTRAEKASTVRYPAFGVLAANWLRINLKRHDCYIAPPSQSFQRSTNPLVSNKLS